MTTCGTFAKISEPTKRVTALPALTKRNPGLEGRIMADSQPNFARTLPQVDASSVRFAWVPGYPAYSVGDDGSVWSLWKSCTAGRGRPLPRIIGTKWRKLTPSSDRQGRKVVNLTDGVSKRQFKVHRLVLMAFVGPCPPKMEGCHNNGINFDNRLENLRWDTMIGNQADRLWHGTHNRGERCGTSKLTKAKVVEIVRRYRNGEASKDLAWEFGVGPEHIARLARKERWPEVFESDKQAAADEQPHVEVRLERLAPTP